MSAVAADPCQKSALVTGCSSGIGYALAAELANRGYRVFACARRLEPMQPLVNEYPHLVVAFRMDVGSEHSVEKAYKFVKSKLPDGKLDVLFNNAGVFCEYPAIDIPEADLKDCIRTNAMGPVLVTRVFSRLVIAAQGTICFTGSVSSILPTPWASVYGASKAFVQQYASVLSLEMEPFRVRVINFVSGDVRTTISETTALDLPEGSVYNCPEGATSFKLRREKKLPIASMDPTTYAIEAIDEIEDGFKYRLNVYLGTGSTTVRFIVTFVPRWLVLRCERKWFALTPLWNRLRSKRFVVENDHKHHGSTVTSAIYTIGDPKEADATKDSV